MISKNEDLFEMQLHELKFFKVKGYTKPIPVLKVAEGWLYCFFEKVVFVPDSSLHEQDHY